MSEKEFLAAVEEILNTEENLTMDTVLDDLEEWDSLSALMFQSFVLGKTKVALKPTELKKAQTVRDLYAFIN